MLIVAYNIRCHRKRKGMTQRELADRVGVHRLTINRIERGKVIPGIPLLVKIAEALDVSTDVLLKDPEKEVG